MANMDGIVDAPDSCRLLEEHQEHEKWEDYLRKQSSCRWPTSTSTSTTIVLLLTLSTLIFVLGGSRLLSSGKHVDAEPDASYFSSNPTVPVPFSHQWVGLEKQEYRGHRYKDEEWMDLFPDYGGIVALSSKFRTSNRLPENAASSPEDGDNKLYYIAGYHQLHCLMVMRDAIYYLNGTIPWPAHDKNGFNWNHVLHCIEAVRLGLTCFLDPTLINLNETWPGIPNGQTHECRNRHALKAFANNHGHPAPVDPSIQGL